jgi:ribosomal protein S18 acetylase RimI-like enzyme
MQIEIPTSCSPDVLQAVKQGMRRHTESRVAWEEYQELTVIARADDGKVIGAALSETGRTWLHLSVVWVDEQSRRQGLGKRLVQTTESEAIRRGCLNAYLDTFSYQAQPFYEKLGYQIFGTLEDYPPGHRRIYMRKRLTPASQSEDA